jgi:hypothetical protein
MMDTMTSAGFITVLVKGRNSRTSGTTPHATRVISWEGLMGCHSHGVGGVCCAPQPALRPPSPPRALPPPPHAAAAAPTAASAPAAATTVCLFWSARGFCTRLADGQCRYAHPPSARCATGDEREDCKHWLRGSCVRSDAECRFKHEPGKRGSTSSESSQVLPISFAPPRRAAPAAAGDRLGAEAEAGADCKYWLRGGCMRSDEACRFHQDPSRRGILLKSVSPLVCAEAPRSAAFKKYDGVQWPEKKLLELAQQALDRMILFN